MRTMSARNTYLSGTVTPTIRATLRRLRLDFGSELYYKNQADIADDYHDGIWCDSCITGANGYRVRVGGTAAYGSSSDSMYHSLADTSTDDWTSTAFTAPSALHAYCRPGIYPAGDRTDSVYFWYVDSSGELKRYTLDTSAWIFSSATTGLALSSLDAVAVHPVSINTVVVVAFTEPYLWVKVATYDGGWSYSADWVVHMSDELVWSDAQWSDAVVSPDDSTKYVVALNLSKWGSAHTIQYDTTSGIWSQPREILPSSEQWGNLKVWVSGLEVIDSRIWAVTVRQPVASGEIRMAHHVALASSVNGTDWQDEYFVTESALRGKLLYNDGDTYCHVAGNVSVARAEATNRLGYDASGLKHTVTEVWGLGVNHSGVGAAPEIAIQATNTSDTLSDSGLLELDNEITVELGASGTNYSDYCKGLLSAPVRFERWERDDLSLQAFGYSSRLFGNNAYAPLAAKNYQNPWYLYSNFNTEAGNARQTIRQVTGTWNTTGSWEVGRHIMYCSVAGIALLPYKLLTPSFMMRAALKAKVSVEGNFIVFWYEDEDNYWRAGAYLDGSQEKVVIQQYVDGVLTTKASTNATFTLDTWYHLYVDTRPGMIRVWAATTADFTINYVSTTYDTTAESTSPPVEHHIGLECEPFIGFEGAEDTGTVTSATSSTLSDSGATFTSSAIGQWVRCNDQSLQVVDYTSTALTLDGYWSETPSVGDDWGLYTADAADGPQMYCKEIFACEARVPWSIDDVINNMLGLCGISRSQVFTSTAIGGLGSASPTMTDVDLTLTTALGTGDSLFWCTTYNDEGPSAYSGTKLGISSTYVTLSDIEGNGRQAAAPPLTTFQDTTIAAVHPSLIDTGSNSKDLRIQANKDVIIVSCNGHFITAFPTETRCLGGYVATVGGGDAATTTEFPQMIDFIWDAATGAGSALARLLQGRRAKLVERADGSVAVSRFDSELANLGTYAVPLQATVSGGRIGERVALVEMVGAEERAFYLDPESARYKLNFVRADNPTVATQEQALVEAKRQAMLSRQRANALEATLYVADPGAELEDLFTVDGTNYIVESCQFSIQLAEDGTPQVGAQIVGRQIPDSITTGTWEGTGESVAYHRWYLPLVPWLGGARRTISADLIIYDGTIKYGE